jgi:hypothetical protein
VKALLAAPQSSAGVVSAETAVLWSLKPRNVLAGFLAALLRLLRNERRRGGIAVRTRISGETRAPRSVNELVTSTAATERPGVAAGPSE